MAATKGDAALENQPAPGIIEQCLARGDGLKKAGFLAFMIDIDLNSRDGSCSMPQVGFHPFILHALRLDEPHLGTELPLAVCHELFQLAECRAGAGAAWM